MAAAIKAPDLVVRHVGDQFQQFRVLAEEMLAHISAVLGFVGLVFAVHHFFHAFEQQAGLVLGEQAIPVAAPDHLDHVPAGAAEHAFQFLDDLAVAAHRAVQALQVAVDHEDQVVEVLASGHRDRAQRFRLVGLAVAEESPYLAALGFDHAAMLQIAHEARLIDRHQRTQAHRHRGELPEVRHQPRMRIGGQAAAVDFLAEFVHLFLADAAFEKGARIHAGRGMALEIHQVAAMIIGLAVEEIIEADVVQRRRRGETGDMSAQFRRFAVGIEHEDHRVPARQRADAVFQFLVAAGALFLVQRDGVDIGRGGADRHVVAGQPRLVDHLVDQEMGALRAFVLQYRLERIQPLLGFLRINVRDIVLPSFNSLSSCCSPALPFPRTGGGELLPSRRTLHRFVFRHQPLDLAVGRFLRDIADDLHRKCRRHQRRLLLHPRQQLVVESAAITQPCTRRA